MDKKTTLKSRIDAPPPPATIFLKNAHQDILKIQPLPSPPIFHLLLFGQK